jgi:hypothetical protein
LLARSRHPSEVKATVVLPGADAGRLCHVLQVQPGCWPGADGQRLSGWQRARVVLQLDLPAHLHHAHVTRWPAAAGTGRHARQPLLALHSSSAVIYGHTYPRHRWWVSPAGSISCASAVSVCTMAMRWPAMCVSLHQHKLQPLGPKLQAARWCVAHIVSHGSAACVQATLMAWCGCGPSRTCTPLQRSTPSPPRSSCTSPRMTSGA